MKVAHVNAGNEFGGGLVHIVSLIKELKIEQADLIVFEEGPVAEAARNEGIRVYVFEQTSRYDIKVLLKLQQFIKRQNYSILHTHGPRANALIALLKPFIHANWIITVHSHPLLDFKDRGLKGKMFERINRMTFKHAEGVIAVSKEIKEICLSFGVSPDQVKVIHNGIKFKKNTGTTSRNEQAAFTLITGGRLTKVKGYDLLMDALKTVDFRNWQWIICGDGEEMNHLKNMADEYDLSHQLCFKGWLNAKEIEQELSMADVFVLPSLSESFPLILLEAANEEIPVIATDVGDVSEVIKDSSTGWLIPPASKKALGEALSQAHSLWEKEQLHIKGKKLKSWAIRFSLEKQAEAVKNVYQEVIENNRE